MADLGSEFSLEVKPNATITMHQEGKPNIVADVTMPVQIWDSDAVLDKTATTNVAVKSKTALTAGTYKGALTYTVSLIPKPVE